MSGVNPFSLNAFMDDSTNLSDENIASNSNKNQRNKKHKKSKSGDSTGNGSGNLVTDNNPFSFRLFLDNKVSAHSHEILHPDLSNSPSPPRLPPPPLLSSTGKDNNVENKIEVEESVLNDLPDITFIPPIVPPLPIHVPQAHLKDHQENERQLLNKVAELQKEINNKNLEIKQLTHNLHAQETRERQETEEMNAVVLQVENNLRLANERRNKAEIENRRLREELDRLKNSMASGRDGSCHLCASCRLIQTQSNQFGEQMEISSTETERKLRELLQCCRLLKTQAQNMQHLGLFEDI